MNKIILDKNAQPRLALSSDTINEYRDAIIDGDKFPPVTVYKDGAKNYLADGFHRYKAVEKAGFTEIECDIKRGDLRAAVFFSLSANSKHGLNRTTSDRRRAVRICLADKEWGKKSERETAKICGVSHTLVSVMKDELVEKKDRDKAAKKGGINATPPQKTVNKQQPKKKKSVGFDEDPNVIPTAPEGKVLVDKDYYEEMLDLYESTMNENEEYEKVMSATDPLKEAQIVIKNLTHEVKAVRVRLTGMTNELREAVKHVKSRDAVIKKQNAKLKENGIV